MKGEIKIIVHATENESKILSNIKNILKIDILSKKIVKSSVTGHYGNPITYINIKLSSQDARNILRIISNSLSTLEKDSFVDMIDDYIDGSTLYLRLDKQRLCRGEISLVEEDPIKIVIKNVSKKMILNLFR